MRHMVLPAILGLLLASPLLAKDAPEKAVVADTPEKFEAQVASIREEMAPGKRYEFLSTRNRDTVNTELDRMSEMLVAAGSVSAMDNKAQAELFSIQEEVNGILARNADDRLVCTHVAPVGSHIPKTVCHTVRELALSKQGLDRQARDLTNSQNAVDTNTRNTNFTQ